MDCYDFDANGDPILGAETKTDNRKTINAPTLLNHDRTDCLLKLENAAKNKAKTIKDSSKKQIHNISIPYEFNVSGEFIIHSESCIVSDGMKLINITTSINELSQQILTFNFSIKQ